MAVSDHPSKGLPDIEHVDIICVYEPQCEFVEGRAVSTVTPSHHARTYAFKSLRRLEVPSKSVALHGTVPSTRSGISHRASSSSFFCMLPPLCHDTGQSYQHLASIECMYMDINTASTASGRLYTRCALPFVYPRTSSPVNYPARHPNTRKRAVSVIRLDKAALTIIGDRSLPP